MRGSIRWCCTPPPRNQRRRSVPLVASAPRTRLTVPPRGSATTRLPRTARSPPAETKPSPREQRERVVDGSALDDAVQVEPDAGRARRRIARRQPHGSRRRGTAVGAAGIVRERGEVAVVARRPRALRRAWGRRGRRSRAWPRARRRACPRTPARHRTGTPAVALTRLSSLSGWKRLKIRSRVANRRSIAARSARDAPATMTVAAHRSECVRLAHRAQEVLVAASGGAVAGARIRPAGGSAGRPRTEAAGSRASRTGCFAWPA